MPANALMPADIPPGVFADTTPASDVAVSVRGLSKSYSIAKNAVQHSTLGEALMSKLRHPFAKAERDTFWALNDVSFDIQKGDVVGIIGRNGAGKSTLLKILSRITEPTQGKIDLYGRVGSLLEVGTGFHAELTGRENIYLNGAILGMKKSEITRQFDAIVDFSGTEQFLDTPVKRYSSGMYVRLAFAVAAHLNPEILIVDEVLAVGDAEFQKKCIGKMQDVAESGRTVLFVSHNMQSISLLCSKGIFLSKGHNTSVLPIKDVVEKYLSSFMLKAQNVDAPERRQGSGEMRFISVAPEKELYLGDEQKKIKFRIAHMHGNLRNAYLSAHIIDESGIVVAQCDSRLTDFWIKNLDAKTIDGVLVITSPWLKPGSYRVELYICTPSSVPIVDRHEDACTLTVSPVMPYTGTTGEDAVMYENVLADFGWRTN